jgi:hypothetical protein
MSKDNKHKLSDDDLDNLAGGSYYKEGGFGRPYVVFEKETLKEHRTWTEQGAKKLDKKLNGESIKLSKPEYHMTKAVQSLMHNDD